MNQQGRAASGIGAMASNARRFHAGRQSAFYGTAASYTEARLIKELEEKGIGRPSTYSMIIDTMQAARLCVAGKPVESSKTHQGVRPSEQGELTSQKLEEFFNEHHQRPLYGQHGNRAG
ncbi:MAG: DNA topoisomerase [Merdibacter sp.]